MRPRQIPFTMASGIYVPPEIEAEILGEYIETHMARDPFIVVPVPIGPTVFPTYNAAPIPTAAHWAGALQHPVAHAINAAIAASELWPSAPPVEAGDLSE
jgi:hypothetical protein